MSHRSANQKLNVIVVSCPLFKRQRRIVKNGLLQYWTWVNWEISRNRTATVLKCFAFFKNVVCTVWCQVRRRDTRRFTRLQTIHNILKKSKICWNNDEIQIYRNRSATAPESEIIVILLCASELTSSLLIATILPHANSFVPVETPSYSVQTVCLCCYAREKVVDVLMNVHTVMRIIKLNLFPVPVRYR